MTIITLTTNYHQSGGHCVSSINGSVLQVSFSSKVVQMTHSHAKNIPNENQFEYILMPRSLQQRALIMIYALDMKNIHACLTNSWIQFFRLLSALQLLSKLTNTTMDEIDR